jgi:hypothetical protein
MHLKSIKPFRYGKKKAETDNSFLASLYINYKQVPEVSRGTVVTLTYKAKFLPGMLHTAAPT